MHLSARSRFASHITCSFLAVLSLHAFIMNGFYFVHPSNNIGTYYSSVVSHLDPSFFEKSVFIDAVERNDLRMSVFFDIIPFFLHKIDFELFAIVQGFLSIFCCIAGIYSLALTLFNDRAVGFMASLLYTVQLNEWTLGSPAPYLNFFHHGLPYTYPLIIWSLAFFFRKRFFAAIVLTGISWNFHPMCTAFLLAAYALYFSVNVRTIGLRTITAMAAVFAVLSLPVSLKTFAHLAYSPEASELWFKGVYWNAWYTCLPSTWSLGRYMHAGCFFILFLLCFIFISDVAVKRDMKPLLAAVGGMCIAGTVFADFIPIPFIIKLSLWRSTIIYLILALPCIAFALCSVMQKGIGYRLCAVMIALCITGYIPSSAVYLFPFLVAAFALALFERPVAFSGAYIQKRFGAVVTVALIAGFCLLYLRSGAASILIALMLAVFFFLLCEAFLRKRRIGCFSPITAGLVFIVFFDAGVLLAGGGIPIYFHGYYKGNFDPWADVQLRSRELSGKDDLFIIPPYLNDFSNYSLRATCGDWAEGANILYLDNRFAEQWFARMNMLGWTNRFNAREGFNDLTTGDIKKAARRFGARFVVTEVSKSFDLDQLYCNEKFRLYKIE